MKKKLLWKFSEVMRENQVNNQRHGFITSFKNLIMSLKKILV